MALKNYKYGTPLKVTNCRGSWIVRETDPSEFRWQCERYGIDVEKALKGEKFDAIGKVRLYAGRERVRSLDEAVQCRMALRPEARFVESLCK